ncbi:MAG TPA: type VI secretion system protein TssA [Aliidongia sp.]|uniref:type VI secretion system protein TssA n=1 Tax=Aliidongia sp. TaxID=1914230 RepID=UPI002DDD436C|nr:type VI secretion system protein TssA [Aliidongia sp.]HEV2677053.1 type VI secretion system protein TssA [Aliidongia sp.]
MAIFDVDKLLIEINPGAPCGENLEYDPVFNALEQASKGKDEQQFGTTVIPGEEPDWVEVRRLALELLERTKDLRIYDQLLRASLRLESMNGLAAGLSLVRKVLDQYWDGLHPQLDPDDDLDPVARVNIIAGLCDGSSFLRPVREAPLVASRTFGRFGLRDVTEEGKSDPAAVNAAFLDVAVETLQETAESVRSAIEDVRGIEEVITDKVGSSNAPDLSALGGVLKEIYRVLQARLSARGVGAEEAGGAEGEEETAEGGEGAPARGAAGGGVPGQLSNRDDVLKTLDRLCEYYARFEPSSPVPILLQRAKRLVPLSFMDILQNLIPDAVTMAQIYNGPSAEE